MGNPPAPPHFHANESLYTWYMGPGFHNSQWKFTMKIETKATPETITNVIGVMKGSVEPGKKW